MTTTLRNFSKSRPRSHYERLSARRLLPLPRGFQCTLERVYRPFLAAVPLITQVQLLSGNDDLVYAAASAVALLRRRLRQ